MGRMSDIDIDTRAQLEWEMNHYDLNEAEKQQYIRYNYGQVASKIMRDKANAKRKPNGG